MDKNNLSNEIQIELTDDIAQGTYANLAVISHSPSEFVLDFIRLLPGTPKAKVQSRIILTPENAKRLMFTLQDNLAKYEEMFGPIRVDFATELENTMPQIKGEA